MLKAIVRSFADNTRIRVKIQSIEDRQKLLTDLQTIYDWARTNNMEFNPDKFEYISHGVTGEEYADNYKGPCDKNIQRNKTIKDLGITVNETLECSDHINKTVATCRAMAGQIMRTFRTRDKKPLLMLYKTYIRSRAEYCNLVWFPHKQQDIAAVEGIQRSYTAKIEDVKHLDYWQRLQELKMYSLERRRER